MRCCGTLYGYKRHLLRGEPTCAACREARAEYMRLYRLGLRVSKQVRRTVSDGRPVTGCCVVCGEPYAGHPVFGDCYRRAVGR